MSEEQVQVRAPARPDWSNDEFGLSIAEQPPAGSGRAYQWKSGQVIAVDPRDVSTFVKFGFVEQISE